MAGGGGGAELRVVGRRADIEVKASENRFGFVHVSWKPLHTGGREERGCSRTPSTERSTATWRGPRFQMSAELCG